MHHRAEMLYLILFRDIEANIQSAKQEIAKYKEDLQQARVIRRHRQEYDALAMVKISVVASFYYMKPYKVNGALFSILYCVKCAVFAP